MACDVLRALAVLLTLSTTGCLQIAAGVLIATRSDGGSSRGGAAPPPPPPGPPAPASGRLAFELVPGAARADDFLSAASVRATDAAGAPITANLLVTLQLVGSGEGALLGTTSQPLVGGLAGFVGLTVDRVGTYSLMATAPGLEPARSSPFVVTANRLVFSSPPLSPCAPGYPLAIGVSAQDAHGGVDPGFQGQIGLQVTSGPSGLTGNLSRAASQGVATFSVLDGVSALEQGTYALQATASGLAPGLFTLSVEHPRVIAFAAAPTVAGVGESVDLSWTVRPPATSLAISPDVGDVSGRTTASTIPFATALPRKGYRLIATCLPPARELTEESWRREYPSLTGSDGAKGVAVLPGGDVVIAGYFLGVITLGAGEANETTLRSASGIGVGGPAYNQDGFLARYRADGTLVWAKTIGVTGVSRDSATAVAACPDGGVLVVGTFEYQVELGAGEPGAVALTGYEEVLLAKYDGAGALQWARSTAGNGLERSSAVAAFPDGSSVVLGTIAGGHPVTFGTGEPNQTTLSPAGPFNAFLAHYDDQGRLIRAQLILGGEAMAIAALDDGSAIACVGGAAGSMTRFRADGSLDWVKPLGNWPQSICAVEDDLLVTGYYYGSLTLGPGEPNQTTLASGLDPLFLARFRRSGELVWAKRVAARGYGNERGRSVAALPDGGAIVTGIQNATGGVFGEGEPGQVTLAGTGGFVARYMADGTLGWVRLLHTRFWTAYGAALPHGAVAFAGELGDSSLGSEDIFLGRIEPVNYRFTEVRAR